LNVAETTIDLTFIKCLLKNEEEKPISVEELNAA
jgi:hypothetical protein